jgi:hypothetical protein
VCSGGSQPSGRPGTCSCSSSRPRTRTQRPGTGGGRSQPIWARSAGAAEQSPGGSEPEWQVARPADTGALPPGELPVKPEVAEPAWQDAESLFHLGASQVRTQAAARGAPPRSPAASRPAGPAPPGVATHWRPVTCEPPRYALAIRSRSARDPPARRGRTSRRTEPRRVPVQHPSPLRTGTTHWSTRNTAPLQRAPTRPLTQKGFDLTPRRSVLATRWAWAPVAGERSWWRGTVAIDP